MDWTRTHAHTHTQSTLHSLDVLRSLTCAALWGGGGVAVVIADPGFGLVAVVTRLLVGPSGRSRWLFFDSFHSPK